MCSFSVEVFTVLELAPCPVKPGPLVSPNAHILLLELNYWYWYQFKSTGKSELRQLFFQTLLL